MAVFDGVYNTPHFFTNTHVQYNENIGVNKSHMYVIDIISVSLKPIYLCYWHGYTVSVVMLVTLSVSLKHRYITL